MTMTNRLDYTKNFDITFNYLGNPKVSKIPSKKIKEILERFIDNLSKEEFSPSWKSRLQNLLVTEKDKERLQKIFTKETCEKLREKDSKIGDIYFIGAGKHNKVWGHKGFPSLVFKIMGSEKADHQFLIAKKAGELVQKTDKSLIQIPKADVIEILDFNRKVYIEEKLSLNLNMREHEEFWARLLMYYESEKASKTFKENIENLFTQIRRFTEMGFWDIGYHNLPEILSNGEGACGVDFENVNLSDGQSIEGLERLAGLAPIPPLVDKTVIVYKNCIPKILEKEIQRYNESGLIGLLSKPTEESIFKEFYISLANKKRCLEACQKALISYDDRSYLTGDEEGIKTPDLSEFSEEEKLIAEALLKRIEEYISCNKNDSTPLTKKRWVSWQPGTAFNMTKNEKFLRHVLEKLEQQGVVVAWAFSLDCTREDPFYNHYYIYF